MISGEISWGSISYPVLPTWIPKTTENQAVAIHFNNRNPSIKNWTWYPHLYSLKERQNNNVIAKNHLHVKMNTTLLVNWAPPPVWVLVILLGADMTGSEPCLLAPDSEPLTPQMLMLEAVATVACQQLIKQPFIMVGFRHAHIRTNWEPLIAVWKGEWILRNPKTLTTLNLSDKSRTCLLQTPLHLQSHARRASPSVCAALCLLIPFLVNLRNGSQGSASCAWHSTNQTSFPRLGLAWHMQVPLSSFEGSPGADWAFSAFSSQFLEVQDWWYSGKRAYPTLDGWLLQPETVSIISHWFVPGEGALMNWHFAAQGRIWPEILSVPVYQSRHPGLHRTLLCISKRNMPAPQNVPFQHLRTKSNRQLWLIRNRQRE